MEDQELVKKFLTFDDEGALQTLIRRYLQPIYNFVYSSVRDRHQAEDITQDVFIKAWAHLKNFDQSKSFKVWIYTIAKNSVYDFLRKKKTIPFSLLEEEGQIYEIADVEPLPDKILRDADEGKKLNAALEKLPLNYRDLIVLYYQNGFNFREIAEILKTSVNTVKSRHLRAIAMLKKILRKKDFQ